MNGALKKAAVALRSPKLALALLLVLALLAVAGTVLPPGELENFYADRLDPHFLSAARAVGLFDTHRSPLFLSLASLLCMSVLYCTWHRLALRKGAFSRGKTSARQRHRLWLDVIMHLSLIVVVAGGVGSGLWRLVGTQYLFVGVDTDTIYVGPGEEEIPLGFILHLRERVDDYFPFRIRVGVSDIESGEKIGLTEVREGESAAVRGEDLKLGVRGFDPVSGALQLTAESRGQKKVFDLSVRKGEDHTVEFPPYRLTLTAFMRLFKRTRGRVAVIDNVRVMKEEWLEPNGRVAYRGTSIFQTAWGVDPYNNPYLGIQVSRDPAAPVFWAGCILFCLSLPLYLFSRHGRRR